MARRMLLLVLGICYLTMPRHVGAQQTNRIHTSFEKGMAIAEYFETGKYFAEANWCAAMDSRGVLFFGNSRGIMRFDGYIELLFESPNDTPVFSMAMAPGDTLYVGLYGMFGRVFHDRNGDAVFDTLSSRIGVEGGFQYVRETHVLDGEAWWRTEKALFRWNGREVQAIRSTHRIRQSHIVHDELYALVNSVGLCRVREDRFELVPGGEYLSREMESAYWMLEYGSEGILIGTRFSGIVLFDGQSITPMWKYHALLGPRILPKCAVRLSDGSIALGTDRKGIWIVDSTGRVIDVIDRHTGLGNNSVRELLADAQNNLWAALEKGIARVSAPSRFSVFDERSDLEGRVLSIKRFNGRLYIATMQGFYYLEPGPIHRQGRRRGARFQPMPELPSNGKSMLHLGNELLLASPAGIYSIDTRGHITQLPARGADILLRPQHTYDTVLVANNFGLHYLVRDGNTWSEHSISEEDEALVYNLLQVDRSTIWAGSVWEGVLRIDIGKGAPSAALTLYGASSGIEVASRIDPVFADGHTLFIDSTGMYSFHEGRERFEPDCAFLSKFKNKPRDTPNFLFQDRFGDIWMRCYTTEDFGQVRKSGSGRYHFDYSQFRMLSGTDFFCMYRDEDGTMWFGASGEVYRYDPTMPAEAESDFTTIIKYVRLDHSLRQLGIADGTSENPLLIPANVKDATFFFRSTSLAKRDRMQYRVWLEGLDGEEWKEYSVEDEIRWSDLPSGDYILHAIAVDPSGRLGSHETLYMHVNLPWYGAWWAIALFIIVPLGLFVVGRLWYRSRVLTVHSRELEVEVRKRTEEIQSQAKEIRQQAEDLERMDGIVRAVNRETHLPSVLEALLMHSLLFFPQADLAMFVRRKLPSEHYGVIAAAGWQAQQVKGFKFSIRDLLGHPDTSMQRMQDGVYLLSGFGERFTEVLRNGNHESMSCMAMIVEQGKTLEGFLVLVSQGGASFTPGDRRRLLRLKEHASSAVAKAGAIEALEGKNRELDETNRQLLDTQQQLVTHEKLAALGELTAGIAHEIQNPLNFVTNFSDLSCELMSELEQDLRNREEELDPHLGRIIETIRSNCGNVRRHGQRATTIVDAMIMHSHTGSGERSSVVLNDLIEEFAQLSYHGMQLQFPQFALELQRDLDKAVGKVQVLPQEFSRAIINLCNNAWEAAIERCANMGNEDNPVVTIRTEQRQDAVYIFIRDNGVGVTEELRERMFEPFFTTKTDSRNAGLGLSMTYEIITTLHNGKLAIHSEDGQFTEVEIMLPGEV